MLRLFFLASVLLGALATDVIDTKKCAEGPKLWCANLKNAKACQAVNHCIQAVWVVQAYPKDNDVTCEVCEELVIQARAYMAKGDTQQAIEKLIVDGCKKLPNAAVSAECVTLAQDYIPEIMQLLAAETDPLTVCTAMRLCNNRRIDEVTKEDTVPAGAISVDVQIDASPAEAAEITFNECDVCQMKMGDLARDFKKAPDQDVMDRMFLVCGDLGTFSTACSSFVANNFDKLRNWIEDRMKPVDMCQLTDRCMQPTSKRIAGSALESDDWCVLCTDTLNQWKSILVQNSTEEDFKELLLDLCTEVGFLVDQCRDVVDQYYVPVYDWLLHEFQPKLICQDVGMCPGKELDSVNVWPIVPAGTGEMLKQRETIGTLNPQIIDKGGLTKDGPLEEDAAWIQEPPKIVRVSLQTSGLSISPQIKPLSVSEVLPQLPLDRLTGVLDVAGSESCAICQTVMHEIENVLSDAQTEEEIKGVVENICDRLPKPLIQECRGFVDRYGDFLIAMLAQKFDPTVVCPKLNLCPEGLDIDVKVVSLAGSEFPKVVAYDLTDMKNNLPDADSYIDADIIVGDDGNGVGNDLKKKNAGESVTCVLCEYAVGLLQQSLNNNNTQEEIREALDSLCDRLPDSVAGECELLVNAYSEELIDAFLLDLTPEQTCRYLMLCKPPKFATSAPAPELAVLEQLFDFRTSAVLPPKEDDDDMVVAEKPKKDGKKPKVDASPGCILCEFVMSRLEEMLKDNTTEHNIEDDLKKVCSVMPGTIRTDCDNFVDQYFDTIIQTLEHLPPHEVCSAIAMCLQRGGQKSPKLKGLFKCEICKEVMKYMKEILMDSRIDKKLSDDLEKLCDHLPKGISKKHRNQCHDIMDHYGPYVVNMLASLEKPEELCSYIDMCPAVLGLVSIDPSLENCALGPKYFCAKKERARTCDKVQFCKDLIWSKKKGEKKFKRSAKQPKRK